MRKKKLKFSGFRITVNTNYQPKSQSDSDELVAKLKHALKQTLGTKDAIEKITTILQPGKIWDSSTISSVEVDFAAEIGDKPQGARVHAHGTVKIHHYTRLQLDIAKIKSLLLHYINHPDVKSLHINVEATSNPDLDWDNYVRKKEKDV